MNIEDLFKHGVTPKAGRNAGKRFRIAQIDKDGALFITDWETGFSGGKLEPGEYDVWREPKTVFDDRSITVTFGRLKEAMAKKGLGDETVIYIRDVFGVNEAYAGIETIDGEKSVVFY